MDDMLDFYIFCRMLALFCCSGLFLLLTWKYLIARCT
jgi:hypothetical protein